MAGPAAIDRDVGKPSLGLVTSDGLGVELRKGLSALSGRRNTVDAQRGRLTTRNSLLMPCAFQ